MLSSTRHFRDTKFFYFYLSLSVCLTPYPSLYHPHTNTKLRKVFHSTKWFARGKKVETWVCLWIIHTSISFWKVLFVKAVTSVVDEDGIRVTHIEMTFFAWNVLVVSITYTLYLIFPHWCTSLLTLTFHPHLGLYLAHCVCSQSNLIRRIWRRKRKEKERENEKVEITWLCSLATTSSCSLFFFDVASLLCSA